MRKRQLEKIWRQLDGATNALDILSDYPQGRELLDKHEDHIDFSAIVSLKNDVEKLIEQKSRK